MNAGDSPRWPLQLVVWALLPMSIVGAGVLSATATLALATSHGVSQEVSPFLVAMVEVVSLAATLLVIFSTVPRLRHRAMALVVGATAVAVVAGWYHYHAVGLLAGIMLVFLIHLASETWLELRERSATQGSTDNPDPQAVEPKVEHELGNVPPSQLGDLDADLVARAVTLLADEPKIGRPRLRAELGVTDHVAKRLLAALRPVKAVEGETA